MQLYRALTFRHFVFLASDVHFLPPILGRSKQCMLDDKASVFVKPVFVNVESLKDSEYKVFRRCVKV